MKRITSNLCIIASIAMMTGCSKDEIETTGNNENTDSDTTQRTEWTGELRHATSSTSIDDNTIVVSWNDTATVEVAYNIYNKVWADIRDGHVTLLASADVDEDLTYILQGKSSDGSLYMDGQYKATFCLNGLTLTNPDSAAINIRDGKRIALYLVEETENTLTDGSGGEQKACFMVKGHTEVSGEGVLNINGNTGHAFWGKEYVQLKATTGTINIKKAVGDGMNVNQYFQMNGGTLNISGVGDDGIEMSYKTDDSENIIPLTEDEDNTSEILIKGGTLNITTTASDSKCLKTEGDININENKGTTVITLSNSGSSSQSSGMGGMGGMGGRPGSQQQTTTSGVASKAIKAEGDINISAGTINAISASHEGIESKGEITIEGGIVTVKAADDAINASGNMTISGGYTYAYSSTNDAVDSNGNFYMNDGVLIAFGSSGAESGIDIDERHSLSISGGHIFGIGGRVDSNLSNCSQAYGYTSRSASFSGNYIVVGTTTSQLWAVKLPTTSYSGILIASSPEMSSGTTYTISTASSIGGSEVNGFVEAPNASNPTQKTTIKATK